MQPQECNLRRTFWHVVIASLWMICLFGCSLDREQPNLQTIDGETTQAVGAQSSGNQPTLIGREATISEIEIEFAESDPVQINAIVRGTVANGCVSIERIEQSRIDDVFWLNVVTARMLETECDNATATFGEGLHLNTVGLPSGNYKVTAYSINSVDETFFLSSDMVVAAEPTAAPEKVSVSGIVWADICSLQDDGTPTIGCTADDAGNYQPDGLLGEDEARIAGILINLKLGECPGGETVRVGATNVQGTFQFDDIQTGFYCVSISADTEPNAAILTSGVWTYPADSAASAGLTTISVGPGQAKTANFGWHYLSETDIPAAITQTPGQTSNDTASTEPSSTSTVTDTIDVAKTESENTAPPCDDAAAYIDDITIPDDTLITPGEAFTKTWQIRNDGTCTWGTGYTFIFDEGDLMDGPTSIPFQVAVPPGREVAISVPLVGPSDAGTYRGDWMIQNNLGEIFGSRGDWAFYLQIVVPETAEE